MQIKKENLNALALNSGFKNILNLSNTKQWKYLILSFFFGIIFSILPSVFLYNLINNWAALLVMFIYFTLPANLLFNGVNYLSDLQEDFETKKMMDPYNPIYAPNSPDNISRFRFTRNIWSWIAALNLPLLVIAMFLNIGSFISLCAFVFFAIFYSAEPIRAKINLYLEPLFFSLYTFPFLISFSILNQNFNILLVIACLSWAYASRVFFLTCSRLYLVSPNSLVQKIGYKGTMILCLILYIIMSLCLIPFLSWFFFVPAVLLIYPILKAFNPPTIDFSTPAVNQTRLNLFVKINLICLIALPIIIALINFFVKR